MRGHEVNEGNDQMLWTKICSFGDQLYSIGDSFSHRLDDQNKKIMDQDNKIIELTAKLDQSMKLSLNLDLELQLTKKHESEKLSNNLVLSGPVISASTPRENLPQTVVDLVKNHTKYQLK